ncbi:hypothetical protein [Thiorhodococcus fuscus]
MSGLSITLAILVGMVVMIWLIRWFQVRARATSPRRLSAYVLAAPTDSSITDHPRPPMVELGVWRPPPRQQLLARQIALRLAAAEQAGAPSADQNPRRILTARSYRQSIRAAETIGSSAPERAEPRAIDRVAIAPAVEPYASRIGRKRRGLESLITELPAVTENDRHDSNAC